MRFTSKSKKVPFNWPLEKRYSGLLRRIRFHRTAAMGLGEGRPPRWAWHIIQMESARRALKSMWREPCACMHRPSVDDMETDSQGDGNCGCVRFETSIAVMNELGRSKLDPINEAFVEV
jgi:hypothetical protein